MGCFFVFIGDVVKAHLGDDFSGENVSNDDDSGYVLDAIVTTYDGSSADHVHRDTDSGMGADTTRLSVAINPVLRSLRPSSQVLFVSQNLTDTVHAYKS